MQPCFSRIVVILMFCLSSLAQAETLLPAPSMAIDQLQQRLLHAPAEYLVTGKATRLEDLPHHQFQPLTADNSNRGIADQAFWLRVSLNNPGSQAVDWVLHHETSYIDNIDLFWQDARQAVQHTTLSDRVPFTDRPVDYRNLAFAHTTPANSSTTLYIKLYFDKPDSVTLNFQLSEASVFEQQKDRENFFYGLFYGAMLILIVISFVGAVLLRQWSYLLYAAFLSFSTLMWALLTAMPTSCCGRHPCSGITRAFILFICWWPPAPLYFHAIFC